MKHICIFTFLLMPVFAFSQYCMQGKVTDEIGTSINEAQIYLYLNGELEALAHTNTNGEYRTGKVPQGKYHVVVSCMGFTSKDDSVAIERDVTQDFILETRSFMLDSVVVMGRSSRLTSKGHVFYLSKKARESGNPFVALQEIPLLYSDPVTESVRSSDGQSMMILIDGMRVNSGISPVDPSRIKSVEIIDVVGAKYMRQGVKRIMNIKLKETSLYTYLQLSARADYPEKSYFASPKFEIGNSSISVYGDASFSTGHNRQTSSYNLETPVLTKEYAGESKSKIKDFDYSLMAKWRISAKDFFAAYVQGNASKEASRNTSSGEQNEYSITRYSINDYHSSLFSATSYYKHLFSNNEEMEIYAVYSDNHAKNTSSLEETLNGVGDVNTLKYDNDRKLTTLTLDYSKDFGNGGSLNIGNEMQYSYDRIEIIGIRSSLFRHHRLNEFAFAGYNGMLARKLAYNITAGMEYVSMRSDSIRHHYFRPRLSFGVYCNITNSLSTKVSYAYSNTPPSVAMLNPYNTSADTLLVSHGNPFLLPSKTHTFGWNASYFSGGLALGTNVSYGISRDIIEPVHLADDNGVLLTTYKNIGRFRSLQLRCNVSWRIKGWFLLMDMAYNVNYYITVGAKKHFKGILLLSKKLGKFEIRTNFSYQNYINTEFSKTKTYNPESNLMLSYSFTPDILLSIGCTSFIGNPRSMTTVGTGTYKSITYTKKKTFTPWILFRWSIRKDDKKKIELENDIIRDHENKIKL